MVRLFAKDESNLDEALHSVGGALKVVQGLSNMTLHFAKVVVANAGTRVPLSATPITAYNLYIVANNDYIYVGDSLVSSTNGFTLSNKSILNLFAGPVDLSQIYIDADTNGDSVNIVYMSG